MRIVPFIVLTVLLLGGVAAAQEFENDPDNPVTEVTRPYEYVNAEGEFRVTWPGGCGKLRRRTNEIPPDVDPFTAIQVVHVSCARNGEEGQGCAVAAIFNQFSVDGGAAGAAEVVDRIEEQLEGFGVRIVEQIPIVKELPDGTRIEGLDVKAVDKHNVGQVWLRGLLVNGDIYVLSAWNLAGGVWDDVEYMDFFNSFLPGTE